MPVGPDDKWFKRYGLGGMSQHVNNDANSNRTFAETNKQFQNACEKAGVKPTKRQASKWRNKTGIAYQKRNETVSA